MSDLRKEFDENAKHGSEDLPYSRTVVRLDHMSA